MHAGAWSARAAALQCTCMCGACAMPTRDLAHEDHVWPQRGGERGVEGRRRILVRVRVRVRVRARVKVRVRVRVRVV